MVQAATQPAGLAAVLDWGNGGGLLGDNKLVFAAMAAGPLVSLAYKGKGIAALSRAATVAAAPVAVYTLAPGRFTAHALAPAVELKEINLDAASIVADLRAILKVYHPLNLAKVLLKNMFIQFFMKFNKYMLEVMDHEKEAITAEAEGREPPPAPPMPDMKPALDNGLFAFARELAVATTRRVYEVLAVRRVGFSRAQPFLRDSKAWIREVLAPKHRAASLRRRVLAYSFATAHAQALFYAAECTVAVALLTRHTLEKQAGSRRQKLAYWARGAGLQVVRCTFILAAASAGAAAGSLVRPGTGTLIGQLTAEIGASICSGIIVNSLLD